MFFSKIRFTLAETNIDIMEETIKDAINYAPDLVKKFILELYEDLDTDGKRVFRTHLDLCFYDMGFDAKEENV